MFCSLPILVFLVLTTVARGDMGTFTLLGVGDQPANGMIGTALAAPAPAAARPAFVTGFNQAWFHNHYGSQWTSNWDEAEVLRLCRATRALGGKVLRIWLFEGKHFEGVLRNGSVATGLDPAKLARIERALELAEQEGVELYVTLFDANICLQSPTQTDKDAWWNVLNDKYGAGAAFRTHVLAPICAVMARHRRAVFALDLMNEVNAMVQHHWFENNWEGARRWVTTWRDEVRRHAAIPVTASYGWGSAVDELLAKRLPESTVDLYDFHVYDDAGSIPSFAKVQAMARSSSIPIYLGEYGQKSAAYDNALQDKVTEAFLRNAKKAGLAGALAWRLSDIRDGHNPEARHSYEAFGTWRPAAEVHRRVSVELGAP